MGVKKLTIGMATYDDFDGVYFTLQSIRLYHPEILNNLEFVIIDNNPNTRHSENIKSLVTWVKQPIQYIPFTEYKSTAVRNKIFEYAKTDYVLSIDSHVLIQPGALKKLYDFFEKGKDEGNLLQGPMLHDDIINVTISTHFDLIWRGQMWGVWARDERGVNPDNPPFEIPAMGLGLFACRKEGWLGFNPKFRGFGGEEGYIHEKYRRIGRKTLCLPFLKWLHRFGRPNGVTYPLTCENKIRNYILGFTELKMDIKPIEEHFKSEINPIEVDFYFNKIKKELNLP